MTLVLLSDARATRGSVTTNQEIEYDFSSIVPEFPSLLILSLFMITTLLAAFIVYKKRRKG
jgi:hypothetical protein